MIEMHCAVVLSFQTCARLVDPLFSSPLVIMSSESNHSVMLQALALSPSCAQLEVTVVKQCEVACFDDIEGKLALDAKGLLKVSASIAFACLPLLSWDAA
jgi:hypothetical protein